MANRKDMPVYLFTGFLEAGKTRFIQETLEDRRFCNGEKTLLLLCEEGEEEYEPDEFASKTVTIRVLEDPSDLTPDHLAALAGETNAERIVIEYNGMWSLDTLYAALPDGWMVAQEFMFADANTFLTYNNNMRNLVVDKLKSCGMVAFNRMDSDEHMMDFHKIVRAVSRSAEIAYEASDGSVQFDEIEDPLPFDMNAPVIEIKDEDYAVWYRELTDNMESFHGKTVRFSGGVSMENVKEPNTFVIGRPIMTCCADDIVIPGIICSWEKADTLKNGDWLTITAGISIQRHKAYRQVGPVLRIIDAKRIETPENPVATFY